MEEKAESRSETVLRVALEAARSHTRNQRMTIESEVDSDTAMAIGNALADALGVEIDGDSIQEWGGSRVKDFVEYIDLLLDE